MRYDRRTKGEADMGLKNEREEAGLSQKELAEKAGINVRMIQHYEQGFKDINKASVMTVLKLAEALDTDVYNIINERSESERIPADRIPVKSTKKVPKRIKIGK